MTPFDHRSHFHFQKKKEGKVELEHVNAEAPHDVVHVEKAVSEKLEEHEKKMKAIKKGLKECPHLKVSFKLLHLKCIFYFL